MTTQKRGSRGHDSPKVGRPPKKSGATTAAATGATTGATRSAAKAILPLDALKESQRLCLGFIRRRRECSRQEIETFFGWTPETVSRVLKPLVDGGILLSHSRQAGDGDRRRNFLYLSPDLLCAIGVEIGFRHVRAAAVSLGGKILHRAKDVEHSNLSPEQTVKRLGGLLADLRAQVNTHPLCGVGVSFVGSLTNPNDASYCFPGTLTWEHVPLLDSMRRVCDLPIEIRSDNVAGALAELRFGAAGGCEDFLFLHMTEGIGLGIVLNGAIHTGSKNAGGEFGHICLQPDGPGCYCGGIGCLESMASSWSILNKVRGRLASGVFSRILSRMDPAGIALADVCRAAEAGEVFVTDALDTAGDWLGLSLSNTADLLDPEKIILGGILADETGYRYLIKRLELAYRRNAHFYRPKGVDLIPSPLGADNYLIGAAAAAFERILPAHPPQIRSGAGAGSVVSA